MALIVLVGLVGIVNISYWVWITIKFPSSSNTNIVNTNNEPLSLVVCSKNDCDKLIGLLDHLYSMGWTQSDDIVIVNDYSKDAKPYEDLKKHYGVNLVLPPVDIIGKKAAVLAGIQAARCNRILLTDTDCRPRKGWKDEMNTALKDADLVVGFSPYVRIQTFLVAWIRFEGFVTAIQYLSFANRGLAYMGVGRNMLLKKSSFESLVLDDLHPKIPSGDDDILVQRAEKVSVSISQESFVDTSPKSTWRDYFSQKIRHYGISSKYPLHIKLLLSWFSFSQIGFFIITIVALVFCPLNWMLPIILLRWLIIMLLSKKSMKSLESEELWLFFPVFDVLLSIYYFIFGLSFLLPKSYKW